MSGAWPCVFLMLVCVENFMPVFVCVCVCVCMRVGDGASVPWVAVPPGMCLK